MQAKHHYFNYFTADRLEHLASPHSPGSGMLAVIDPAIERASDLAAGLLPGASVLVLDPARDGIAQISDFLRHHSGYTSLHLIGHGAPGCLYLSKTHLTLNNLHRYTAHFQQWTAALGQGFDLLLYGCEVAQGPRGRAFVQHLAHLAHAQILASTTPTGHAALGGDWRLDYATHPDRAQRPALTASAMAAYPAILADRVVNNVSELITAINDSNANGDADRILLNATTFPIGSVHTADSLYGPLGLPAITTDISIVLNTGIANATIERTGSDPFRLFLVKNSGTLTLDGDGGSFDAGNGDFSSPKLTIRNGFAKKAATDQSVGDDGGALVNAGGTVRIDNVAFRDNRATDDGGAIANIGLTEDGGEAIMTIYDSLFTNNEALTDSGLDDGGGAIENDGNRDEIGKGATLTINKTSITNNRTNSGSGGGIRSRDGSGLIIQDSSITNNNAAKGGGIALGASPGVPAGTTSLAIGGTTVTGNSGLDVVDAAPGPEGTTAITNNGGNNVGTTDAPELASAPVLIVSSAGGQIADNGTFFLGDTNPGEPKTILFKIDNIGNKPLKLKKPVLVGADSNVTLNLVSSAAFNQDLDSDGTSAEASLGKDDAPLEFELIVSGDQVANFSGKLNLQTIDTPSDPNDTAENVSADGLFNFDFSGTVGQPAPVAGKTLSFDGANRLFALGDLTAGGSNLVLKLANAKSSKILDVRVSKVNANKQTVEVLDPLSILPDGFRPNGFGSGKQSSVFSFSSVTAGDRFTIAIQTIDGQTISLDSSQVQVRDLGGGQWSLNFNDSSFGSVELLLSQTTSRDAIGAGSNQRQGLEILDLSGLSSGNANFAVYREAAFNNFVGFYRIDNLSGTVGGVTPGSSGYAQAALNARVSSIALSVGNQGTASSSASLGGNAFYAPFILVDADINQFLEENPNNQGGDGPQAYFIFASANPDGVDHIRLLGDNTFGFEDLPGGGDFDFNDLIVTVDISIG